MGFVLGFCICLLFLIRCSSFLSLLASSKTGESSGQPTIPIEASIIFKNNGSATIATIDKDFICATLDWWPSTKCDYNVCSWKNTSLLNLDLNNIILLNAVKAFTPLKIRMGGTLQDKVIYENEDFKKNQCGPFSKNGSHLFGFTHGCLPRKRWDELNKFLKKSGAVAFFGLNALRGRNISYKLKVATGAWNTSNAEPFIRYTLSRGYPISGWELGNELSGTGIGLDITADQYVSDTIALHIMLKKIYQKASWTPLVIAPAGFFEKKWFSKFINKTQNSVNVITHHIYNLGSGNDTRLAEKILSPDNLSTVRETFKSLRGILKASGSEAKAWVGEAGGSYNSGGPNVSNTFVDSFWYLDQLGMASVFDTKTYCRQTLIGGNYGLLDSVTFLPNPDYYSALLWHRLMGEGVLEVEFKSPNKTRKLRTYANCAKPSKGITLLLINLHHRKVIYAQPECPQNWKCHLRNEYHLTSGTRGLHSQTMLLNNATLKLSSSKEIPKLKPKAAMSKLIKVQPLSIVFIHLLNARPLACE